MAPALAARVAPDGIAILAGITLAQAPTLLARYRAARLTERARRREGEWVALVLGRGGAG